MKKKVIVFGGVLLLILILPHTATWADQPWKSLAKSPGQIEAAVAGPDGGVCVLEQWSFIRSMPEEAQPIIMELSPSQRIFLSAGGTKYASIAYEGAGELPQAAQVAVYTSAGQALWNVSNHPLNDVILLDTGGLVGVQRNINVLDNAVYFFGSGGKLLAEVSLPALGEVLAAPSGDRILANSGTRGTLLFDNTGTVLSEMEPAYRMTFSQDGRWTAILYGPKLKVYHEGVATYVGSLGGEIVRGAQFSPENSFIVAFTDHALFLLKNPGGEVLLQRQLEANGELSYTSADVIRQGALIAVGIERDLGSGVKGPERHPDGQVLIYRKNGDVCYRMPVTYTRWNTTTPRVQFSDDGARLLVLTRDEVIQADVAELCGKGGAQ